MTRSRRISLVLVGLAILVAGVIFGGTVLERRNADAVRPPVAATWESSSPGVTPTQRTVTPTPSPRPPRYVFPVAGKVGYGRTHHDYPGTDIIAPCGSMIRATTDGTILEVNRKDIWNAKTDLGPNRGGLSVSLLGDDGVRYYGSHFRSIDVGIEPGARVGAGQSLGKVGDTGDASVCHLHYGISPGCARTGDWWIRRGEVWPWPFLDSWRAGGQLSPVSAVAAFSKAHGCPPLSGIPEP